MKKTITLIIIALLSLNILDAIGTGPQIPCVFIGHITYSENSSLDLRGYNINVSVDSGEQWKVGEVQQNNYYDVAIEDMLRDNGYDISLWIGGIKAKEVGIWETRETKELDLTINSLPIQQNPAYCGDLNCNDGESCSNCASDCGVCQNTETKDNSGDDSSSGGSSRGGSGGGSGGGFQMITENSASPRNSNGNVIMTGSAAENIKGAYSNSEKIIAGLGGIIVLLIILIFLVSKKKR